MTAQMTTYTKQAWPRQTILYLFWLVGWLYFTLSSYSFLFTHSMRRVQILLKHSHTLLDTRPGIWYNTRTRYRRVLLVTGEILIGTRILVMGTTSITCGCPTRWPRMGIKLPLSCTVATYNNKKFYVAKLYCYTKNVNLQPLQLAIAFIL